MAEFSGPNFGLLNVQAQPPAAPQVIATPNRAEQNMQGLAQGIEAGNAIQQNSRAAAMQPGLLQAQQLANQGQAIKNQQEQIALAQQQHEAQVQTQLATAAQKGTPQYENTLKQLDPVKYQAYMTSKASTYGLILQNKKSLMDVNTADLKTGMDKVQTVGNIAFGINRQAGGDPMQAWTLYNQEYPTLAKGAPYLPNPSTVPGKTDQEKATNFQHMAMGAMTASSEINKNISDNPYLQHLLYPSGIAGQALSQKDITGKINAQIMPQIAVKNAEVENSALANRATNQINAAQTEADTSQKQISAMNQYSSQLAAIQDEYKGMTTRGIIGTGAKAGQAAMKGLEVLTGKAPRGLTEQAAMDQLSGELTAQTMMSLQKGRVVPVMADAINKTIPNKSDPIEAQKQMIKNYTYAKQLNVSYAGFLKDFAAQNHNHMEGADSAWQQFQTDTVANSEGKFEPSDLNRKAYMPYVQNPEYQAVKNAPTSKVATAPTPGAWTPESGMNPAEFILKQKQSKK